MATPSSPRQLCAPCAAIFAATSLDLQAPSHPHHRDMASFYAAVAAGCPMCTALLTEWEDDAPSDDETAPFHTVYTLFRDLLHEHQPPPDKPLSKAPGLKNVLVLNLVASNRRSRQFILLPSSGTTSFSPAGSSCHPVILLSNPFVN